MQVINANEAESVFGAGTTQSFDDGSSITYDDAGNVESVTDSTGMVLNYAGGTLGGYLYGLAAGPGVFNTAPGAALGIALVAFGRGVGQYNSAAGPGPGGTQNLPPSLPPMP